MCGSMVDIQSPTAEIRRAKKEEEEETTAWKYTWPALLRRAAIKESQTTEPSYPLYLGNSLTDLHEIWHVTPFDSPHLSITR